MAPVDPDRQFTRAVRRAAAAVLPRDAALSPAPGVSRLMPVQIALDGRFLDFDARYARYLGHAPEALRRLHFLDVTCDADVGWQRRDRQRLLSRKVEALQFDKRYRTRSGRLVWAAVCVAPVRDPDGKARRVFSFVRDITRWKEARELRRPLLETLEEKTALELRGPPSFPARDASLLARLPPALESIAAHRPLPGELPLENLLDLVARRPTVALDRRGRPIWMSPRVRALLSPWGGSLPEAISLAARDLALLAPPAVGSFEVGGLQADLFVTRDRLVLVELARAGAPPDLTGIAARYGLTQAECGVLGALALGLSNAEIGRRLSLSVNTVQTHLQRILRKLGVSSRLRAALLVKDSA